MFLKLQIVFCILAAACVAAILPVGTFLGWKAALVFGVGAFLCFGAMNYCKQMHLRRHPDDCIPDEQHNEETEKNEEKE